MKKFLKAIGLLLVIGTLLSGVAYYYFGGQIWGEFYQGHQEFEDATLKAEQEELNRLLAIQNGYGEDRPLVFLIAGIDTDDVAAGRSDALMVALVDTKEKQVDLLSLPRDLRVEMGTRGYDKLNAAYAYGGISLTKNTVSKYLDIPIDQYFIVNFDGFKELIDVIGGLDINVEKSMRFHDRLSNKMFELSAGQQTLSGYEALNYARFRKDNEGDFGRMRRQQQVIREMIGQTATLGNVTKISDITQALGDNMRTDIDFNDATKLGATFIGVNGDNIKGMEITSTTSTIGGASYVLIEESELSRIKTELQRILKRQ